MKATSVLYCGALPRKWWVRFSDPVRGLERWAEDMGIDPKTYAIRDHSCYFEKQEDATICMLSFK